MSTVVPGTSRRRWPRRSGRLGRIGAIARHDARILRNDPVFVVVFTIMPIAYMAFTRGAFGLVDAKGSGGNGAAQVVPGGAVLFSGFLVGNLGFAVFREHGWHTWERLRATALDTTELMVGKSIVPTATLVFQLAVLLGLGTLLFDLEVAGSWFAFLTVAALLTVMEVTLGFMLLAVCRSVLQLNALTNLGAMLLSGLGGALTPVQTLPTWAQHLAPATPAYWAMRGFRSTVDGGGFAEIAAPAAVLLGFSLTFALIAAKAFSVEAAKVSWE
ncbi:MAG: ABC transporter permease [Microthrixaceae bacterium]